MSSSTTDPRASPVAVASTNDDASNVSGLTSSGTSSITDRCRSIFAEAKSILRGEIPSEILEEVDIPVDDDTRSIHDHPSVTHFDLTDHGDEEEEVDHRNESDPRHLFPEETGSVTSSRASSSTKIDFRNDLPKDMTYSRRIALSLMKTKAWYNPRLKEELDEKDNGNGNGSIDTDDGEHSKPPVITSPLRESRTGGYIKLEKPSLEKSWGYFEHVTLPRFIVRQPLNGVGDAPVPKKNVFVRIYRKFFCKADKELDRAEPGETAFPTSLYSPVFTPLKQMGDFGLGVGLYFSTIRSLMVLVFCAGLINIPNFMYFVGDDYTDDNQSGVPALKRGSAICTDTEFVLCTNCNIDDFPNNRIISHNNNTYALKNNCDGPTLQQGFINYACLLFMMVGIVVLNIYQKRMEVSMDEDEQTAQDYSIVIENPPGDAVEPQEWKDFFQNAFQADVTVCTIALDNDILVNALVDRRVCRRKLEMILEPGTSLEPLDLARIASQQERERKAFQRFMALLLPGVPEIVGRMTVLTAKVQGLAQLDFPATRVFITFESEDDQRKVLSTLNYGSSKASRQKTKGIDPQHLFRGTHVLRVEEPDEPSTIRWQDLNVKWMARMKQLALTMVATFAAILVCAFLVRFCAGVNPAWASIAISVANSIFPMFAKILTALEPHPSEGAKQTSLYLKIALFRWVNTAIIFTIITPFTDTLDAEDGIVSGVYAIFIADIGLTNVILLLDPVGHLQKHFVAPRAKTQDAMNLAMKGTEYELAERYTNMTKLLFLCFWYSAIFPASFFLCAFAFFMIYFVDRFALMRIWARTPKLGTKIARFSRKYFFSLAICAMAVISSYAWTGFPYDNLCENEDSVVDSSFSGNMTTESGKSTFVNVNEGDSTYRYCLQDLYRTDGIQNFPAVPENQPDGNEWMTDDQETLTRVYGWTSVAVLGMVALKFIFGWYQNVMKMFRGTYKACGDDQGINFSQVQSIDAYIPQVYTSVFSYPLLPCETEKFGEELFDWNDAEHEHSYYDLHLDAVELLDGIHAEAEHVFSKVAHWPPERVHEKKVD